MPTSNHARNMRTLMWQILLVSCSKSSLDHSLRWPLDVAYTRTWPTSTPEAAKALAVAAETHQVNPLPAYDQNGVLLEPQYYSKRLDGATVVLCFELTHYLIHKKDQHAIDTLSAHIVQLRIILPLPRSSPTTPRKKKIPLHDNYFGTFTPTKRRRGDDNDNKGNDERAAKTMRYAICATTHFMNADWCLRCIASSSHA